MENTIRILIKLLATPIVILITLVLLTFFITIGSILWILTFMRVLLLYTSAIIAQSFGAKTEPSSILDSLVSFSLLYIKILKDLLKIPIEIWRETEAKEYKLRELATIKYNFFINHIISDLLVIGTLFVSGYIALLKFLGLISLGNMKIIWNIKEEYENGVLLNDKHFSEWYMLGVLILIPIAIAIVASVPHKYREHPILNFFVNVTFMLGFGLGISVGMKIITWVALFFIN